MSVVEFSDSFTSSVPAAKLFKTWYIDSHEILPKIASDHVKSVEVEGGVGAGSTVCINFADGIPVKFVKHKVDVLDEATLTYADTLVEGGELSDTILKVTHEVKFESSPEGGCSATILVKYYLKEGTTLTEDDIKHSKAGAVGLFKALEAYALAN